MSGDASTGANSRRSVVSGILFAGLAVHICCILILSSVPPISRDALNHHLVVPKLYLLHGGIYEIPHMFFAYFPMNVDLLYMVPLYFGNDIAPKYIHFFFALLTAGLIFKYLKKELNNIYGMIGALFFLTIPVVVKLSVTVYVDLGLIFFSWATLYYFLEWYDTNFRFRYLLISGVFCGLALGTKYNGLILLPIMGVLVAVGFSLKKNRLLDKNETLKRNVNSIHGIKWGGLFLLVALIVFSPWMVRNIIWKQNPVYPLFDRVFHSLSSSAPSSPNDKQNQEDSQNAFWTRRHIYKESFGETLLIPVRAFFQGQDDNPKYFDGRLNPFLFFLPIMAFFRRKEDSCSEKKAHKFVFLLFSVFFILFVLFQSDFRIRYMSPAIPPLIVLAVFGLKNILGIAATQKTGWTKTIMMSVGVFTIILAFAYNANYICEQFYYYIRPMDYLSGKVDRDTYISRYRKEHAVMVRANQVLPAGAKVLCLSIGDRTYYLDRAAHLAKDFYDRKNGTFNESDILKKLKRYGTTHVIVDKHTLFNWLRTLDGNERGAFLNVFQHNTKTMYEKNGVLLLEVIHPEKIQKDDNGS